jgi:hypothetical protein
MIFLLIISFFFVLGLLHLQIINIFNKLLSFLFKNNIIFKNKLIYYFNMNKDIFLNIFKFFIYFLLLYALYLTILKYNEFDSNMIFFKFDDLENLSKTVNESVNITNNNPINLDKLVEHLPNTLGAMGAYKAGMKVAKHVPTVGGKAIVTALVAGTTAGAVSLGTHLGEKIVKDTIIKSNKFILDIFTNNSIHSNINLDVFPYNLLSDMLILNSCCIGLFIVIFNLLVVDHIKNINILSYLPNFIKSSKLYTIIEFFFNRYIKIWNMSKKPILIICLICIIINLSLVQLGLYVILHN